MNIVLHEMWSLGKGGRLVGRLAHPPAALLQWHSANLHDSASERGRDWSDRDPVNLIFCSELRVYIHNRSYGYSIFHAPITESEL